MMYGVVLISRQNSGTVAPGCRDRMGAGPVAEASVTELNLYYSNGACSLAPHIALEEAGVAYTATPVDTPGGEQYRPAFLAVNPKGRVPALRVDDWVLTECPAILAYVAQAYPAARLWPAALADQARAMEWMGWLSSGVHIAYAHIRRPERYVTGDAGLANVRAQGNVTTRAVWQAVEQRLSETGPGTWAVGDSYSVVDPYLLTFWLWGRGAVLGYDMARDFPAWTDHARRMGARPAVQRVLAREGAALP